MSHPEEGGVGTFPNYLNGYVPPNRVCDFGTLLFTAKLVGHVVSEPVFYIEGRLGKILKINS